MKVSTEIDNNFGYEKITQLVDNIPLMSSLLIFKCIMSHGTMKYTLKAHFYYFVFMALSITLFVLTPSRFLHFRKYN
jgi:hypothetical protein